HVIGELLVVAADTGMQAGGLLQRRRLDLIESVRPIALENDGEHALTTGLVGREDVAHTARRVHSSHVSIFPGLAAACGRIRAAHSSAARTSSSSIRNRSRRARSASQPL